MAKTAKERIESAKKKYEVAEQATDSLLLRLMQSRWSLAVIVSAVVVAGLVVWLT